MLADNLNAITAADLQRLCDQSESESTTLDFKQEAIESRKVNTLVTALANAEGGDIVFGIEDEEGMAKKIVPLTSDRDVFVRQMTDSIARNIEPRIEGIRYRVLDVEGGYCVIVRVPASFDAPHALSEGSSRRFVYRVMTQTVDFTMEQIRSMFERRSTLWQRAETVASESLARLRAGERWKPMPAGPIAYLYLVPLTGLSGRIRIDVAAILQAGVSAWRWPPGMNYVDWMPSINGLGMWSRLGDEASSYWVLHRTGMIETTCALGWNNPQGPISIPSRTMCEYFRNGVGYGVERLKTLGFSGPALLTMGLLDVNGVELGLDSMRYSSSHRAEQPTLALPATVIDDVSKVVDIDTIVRPLLDILWQGFGLQRCFEYSDDGVWAPRR